jgi:hypothetical protein
MQNTFFAKLSAAATALLISTAAYGQNPAFHDPAVTATFDQAVAALGMQGQAGYRFGTNATKNVINLTILSTYFSAYGIAGTNVINSEWERYQPFNASNFQLMPDSLDLVATIPQGGGLFPGGINSGQIWTQHTYQPVTTGAQYYAFSVRMKTPGGPGMWPAAWFYTKQPGLNDDSEIDMEFFDAQWQNEFDWSGFNHGAGTGADFYSIMTNQFVWHPGLNFSADYHEYQFIWTPDAIYKYVDGTLIKATWFKWTSNGPAQFGINLAVGTPNMPGLLPTSVSQFPARISIDSLTIWQR